MVRLRRGFAVCNRSAPPTSLTPQTGVHARKCPAGRPVPASSGAASSRIDEISNTRSSSARCQAKKSSSSSWKLGERVDSPDAVNLPGPAIAILEDSDGNIDLDLPVSGSLDDPQFSYGKIVWKAVVNVLGKIATAPFRALGNLLGISSEKLEAVAFDPGSAELAPPEQEKLKKLAEAMAKRPSLVLTIPPGYDPVADKKALQEAAVRRDVAQEMSLKLKAGEKPGPIDLNNPKAQAALRTLGPGTFAGGQEPQAAGQIQGLSGSVKAHRPGGIRGHADAASAMGTGIGCGTQKRWPMHVPPLCSSRWRPWAAGSPRVRPNPSMAMGMT